MIAVPDWVKEDNFGLDLKRAMVIEAAEDEEDEDFADFEDLDVDDFEREELDMFIDELDRAEHEANAEDREDHPLGAA